MGAQFIKHIIWDDLATSGWKHLFPMQSNLKKFEEIWRFILLIRSLSRRCARRQNLNVVVWASAKEGSENISSWVSVLLLHTAYLCVSVLFVHSIVKYYCRGRYIAVTEQPLIWHGKKITPKVSFIQFWITEVREIIPSQCWEGGLAYYNIIIL